MNSKSKSNNVLVVLNILMFELSFYIKECGNSKMPKMKNNLLNILQFALKF